MDFAIYNLHFFTTRINVLFQIYPIEHSQALIFCLNSPKELQVCIHSVNLPGREV